jgi:hypothetical protein
MEHGWNDAHTKNKNDLLKGKFVPVPLDHHQSQKNWPGFEPGRVNERLETNHLSHRMDPFQCRCYMFRMVTQH